MKLPAWLQVLLWKVGIDLCDFCTWRLGKDMNFWGDLRLCDKCDAKMSAQYDAAWKKESSRQPI